MEAPDRRAEDADRSLGDAPANELLPLLSTSATAFDTTEVRWFGSGPLPPTVLGWFTTEDRLGVVEVRTDSYRIDGRRELGIKRRGGVILEAKLRRGRGPRVTVLPGLTGNVELWRKWRADSLPAPDSDSTVWVDVHKSVVTRTFVLVGGVAEPNDDPDFAAPDFAAPGCEVELTDVRVGDEAAWSLCLEAFGPEETQLASLEAAGRRVAAHTPHPEALTAGLDENLGYPAWLDRHISVAPPGSAEGAGRTATRHPHATRRWRWHPHTVPQPR